MQQDVVMQESLTETSTVGNGRISLLSLLKLRNFRLLWLGEAISLIGDQFYLIALPWLTLQLTGDALAVGTVLAIAGVPRALFMLIGGAFTDRFSPRLIMFGTNMARMLLVGLLASLIFAGFIQLWMLYLFALLFGLADAFFFPAQSAIVPQLVEKDALPSGNAIIQGTAQLSLFLGPVMAGTIIAFFSKSNSSLGGLAIAFGVDALTFLASAITLWFIRLEPSAEAKETESDGESLLKGIGVTLKYVGRDTILRTFFIINLAISTLMTGVIAVGIPVLADGRFAEGAAAFGLIMSALGAGSLIGMAIASVLPKPREGLFGPMMLIVTAVSAFNLILFALIASVWIAVANILVMGVANGYVMIMLITWLQLRTPSAMLGRMMSVIMFSSVGMAPLATAVAGAIIKLDLNSLFIGAGTLLLVVIFIAVSNPAVRAMPPNPTPE